MAKNIDPEDAAAGDLDVEAGMDEASGRLPNTGGAHVGLPESEWSQMSRTERNAGMAVEDKTLILGGWGGDCTQT